MGKKLYKFNWDCGRMGNVNSLFIADEKRVERVIGEEVYFGEILGKHSEVYDTLKRSDLKVINVDEKVLEILENELGETLSGHNPIEYYEDREEELEDE